MKYIRWDEYYAVAEDLHKKIGTINVPANYIYKGYPIGEWISRQRGIERKNGLKSVRKKKRSGSMSFHPTHIFYLIK